MPPCFTNSRHGIGTDCRQARRKAKTARTPACSRTVIERCMSLRGTLWIAVVSAPPEVGGPGPVARPFAQRGSICLQDLGVGM
jgi:hypothetical protein